MAKLLVILTPTEYSTARAFMVDNITMEVACNPYDYFGQLVRICELEEHEGIVCAIPLSDREAEDIRHFMTDWRGERLEVIDVKLA